MMSDTVKMDQPGIGGCRGRAARCGATLETRCPVVEPGLHGLVVVITAEGHPGLTDLAEDAF